jgi:hypothetical protein
MLAIGIAIGAAAGVLAALLGGAWLAGAVALFLLAFAPRLWIRYGAPRPIRAQMLKALDPVSGPPAGAEPGTSELPRRIDNALNAREWRALRSLLAGDFALIDLKGRRFDASMHVKTCRGLAHAYPDVRQTTEEVLTDPVEADVLWVRGTLVGHPRFGPALDVTSWTRMTLTPDGERVRELANGGVIRVA